MPLFHTLRRPGHETVRLHTYIAENAPYCNLRLPQQYTLPAPLQVLCTHATFTRSLDSQLINTQHLFPSPKVRRILACQHSWSRPCKNPHEFIGQHSFFLISKIVVLLTLSMMRRCSCRCVGLLQKLYVNLGRTIQGADIDSLYRRLAFPSRQSNVPMVYPTSLNCLTCLQGTQAGAVSS